MECLSCRATHCVRLKVTDHAENDNLYNIFALYSGQDCEFIRRWLKFFMTTVYPKNFETAGHYCLDPKGLTLDIWVDGIEDRWKGDFLTLYGLNLMLNIHTLVHIKNNRLWTTIKNPSPNHDNLLKMCNFHLAYVGRGLFVELTERKRPLTVVDEDTDTKTVVIGELTFDECDTLDKVIYRGLGFGVDKSGIPLHSLPYTIGCENEGVITIKEEEEHDTESPIAPIDYGKLEREFSLKILSIRCSHDEVEQYLQSIQQHAQSETSSAVLCEKMVCVYVHKLNLGTLSSIKLNPDLLRKLHVTVDYDSDKTEEYWPMDNDQSPNFEPILVSKPKKAMETPKRKIKSKPSKGGFSFSVHGVKKCKRRTYLSCKVDDCKTKFNSVKAWNAHHR